MLKHIKKFTYVKNPIDISPAIPKSLLAHRQQKRSREAHMNFKKVPETSYISHQLHFW